MALVKCINCGEEISDKAVECPHCGFKVIEVTKTNIKKVCKECGNELESDAVVCPKCGCPVEEENDNFFENSQVKTNKKSINKKVIGIAVLAVVILAIAIKLFTGGSKSNILSKTYDKLCKDSIYARLTDDGSSLILDTNPYDKDDGSTYEGYQLVLSVNKELGFGESLNEKMNHTRSLDGTQTDSNDQVKVSWTYHPDDGLEAVYELNKK